MPELPETETIARDLAELITGAVVARTDVIRNDVVVGVPASRLSSRLLGRSVAAVWRRAKTVVLSLDDDQKVLVQPRFTGALRVVASGDEVPYACVILGLSDSRSLVYADVRRLGTFRLATPREFESFDQSLGVEPLDPTFTSARLSGILRGSKRPVKGLLMDQHRIAGCGNIYANEALWLAGIDPSKPGASVTAVEAERLRDALVSILTASIAQRGTTFRDYRDARGARGGFAAALRVYGRGGEACPTCGRRLTETHEIDGRSTVFCHRCQR